MANSFALCERDKMLVKVFPYQAFDIHSDQFILSEHYATREAIERFNARQIAAECYYVAQDDLDGDGRILKTTLHEIVSQNIAHSNEVKKS